MESSGMGADMGWPLLLGRGLLTVGVAGVLMLWDMETLAGMLVEEEVVEVEEASDVAEEEGEVVVVDWAWTRTNTTMISATSLCCRIVVFFSLRTREGKKEGDMARGACSFKKATKRSQVSRGWKRGLCKNVEKVKERLFFFFF
ncbi:hypothetical protein DM01DRAFT_28887, partial [Hesseltinella vesiculosa]